MMAVARRGLAAVVRRLPDGLRRSLRAVGRVVGGTVDACVKHRVLGLSGEAAFFAILSLPPLIFGLAGTIGFIAQRFDVATIANFRDQVLLLAGRALTPEAVNGVVAPTLDEVLGGGRFEVVSIGFLIALWSGSRALGVFVDAISIMYGLRGHRGIIRTRALSFLLYLVFLIAGVVLLPLVLAGPTLVHQVLPEPARIVANLYWPVVLVLSVCLLATAYHLSVPVRTRWRADLPGAVLALLIWLHVSSLAILVGAAFNAALDEVWPALSGIDGNRASKVSEYLDKNGD